MHPSVSESSGTHWQCHGWDSKVFHKFGLLFSFGYGLSPPILPTCHPHIHLPTRRANGNFIFLGRFNFASCPRWIGYGERFLDGKSSQGGAAPRGSWARLHILVLIWMGDTWFRLPVCVWAGVGVALEQACDVCLCIILGNACKDAAK